jgi:imidazoleglycerol-phosphate dehydratase/histidinol-phosphatase
MNFEVRITICHYFEKTNETDIYIHLNLDGTGKAKSKLESFFDHMLDKLPVMDKWT